MTDFWPHLRYFKRGEPGLASPDQPDSWHLLQPHLMIRLDALRGLMGKPFRINSGFRTASHNERVGGAPRSAHVLGLAVDVSTAGWTREERGRLVRAARQLGFRGIGVETNYVHLDVQARDAAWIYRDGKRPPIPVGREIEFV
jgi:uncharacterized protein YcbK (DUF882 family)